MKVERKWYVTIEIEVDGGDGSDEIVEEACDRAEQAYLKAKEAFFDSLNDSEDSAEIEGYDVLDEEDK